MRLESLDIDHPEEAHTELDQLARQLRGTGWTVEVAGLGEPTWSRLRESAEHALVDVLNIVLDETERHLIDAVIDVVVAWAATRLFFRGRERTKPDVAIWIDGDIVRTVPLPGTRFDILLQVEVASLAAGRDLERALNQILPDGDGLKLTAAGEVSGLHLQTGLAEVRGDSEGDAVATVCAAFGTQGMTVVRRERSPAGDAPLLAFAPAAAAERK
jgi:hypothetical protein